MNNLQVNQGASGALDTKSPVTGDAVMKFHDEILSGQTDPQAPHFSVGSIWYWIQANHQNNHQLWNEEDLARRTTVGAEEIAANKRAIDRLNQARNDATERVDELLLVMLGWVKEESARSDAPMVWVPAGARLHSETIGSMIDRLSILALKIFAMRAQTQRTDVEQAHIQSSQVKLDKLSQQRQDLAQCLDNLLTEARSGKAYFKIYRQFKMYNDPRWNPVLVAEQKSR
jgi:hypothetical protein